MDNLTMAVMNAIINLAYFILFLFLWFQRRERSLGFFAGAFGAALVGALGLSLQNSPVGIAGILALNIGLYIFYLLGRVRKGDVLGRWGGEEFLLLLPNTALKQALALGESLREIQEALVHGEMGVVTLSGGVTQYEPGESRAFFLQKADQALYRAKKEGRNCIRSQLGENSI